MATGTTLHADYQAADFSSGGTGARFARAIIIVAGVCALVASLVTFVAVWLQTKNYRKPVLQRYVVRILLMVPIYAASSWASLVSTIASAYVEPFRDVYE
ncbi:Solute-trans-a domain containing protein, partial [Pyrenophora tritici-repentis]